MAEMEPRKYVLSWRRLLPSHWNAGSVAAGNAWGDAGSIGGVYGHGGGAHQRPRYQPCAEPGGMGLQRPSLQSLGPGVHELLFSVDCGVVFGAGAPPAAAAAPVWGSVAPAAAGVDGGNAGRGKRA